MTPIMATARDSRLWRKTKRKPRMIEPVIEMDDGVALLLDIFFSRTPTSTGTRVSVKISAPRRANPSV